MRFLSRSEGPSLRRKNQGPREGPWGPPQQARKGGGTLKLGDPQSAHGSKGMVELARSWLILSLANIGHVRNASSSYLARAEGLLGSRLLSALVRQTIYPHFVAGEKEYQVAQSLYRLAHMGQGAILGYCVEGQGGEEWEEDDQDQWDHNLGLFLQSVDLVAASSVPSLPSPCVAVKVSSLCRLPLLLYLSTLLGELGMRVAGGSELEGVSKQLTEGERRELVALQGRLETLVKAAAARDVTVMVDAEQSRYQEAIRHLALDLMEEWNREAAVVVNTYQAYLEGTPVQLTSDLARARRQGWMLGAKLVRGAYLGEERSLARSQGRLDPTVVDIEATRRQYREMVALCLEDSGRVRVVLATHNQGDVVWAVERRQTPALQWIHPEQAHIVEFAQLQGLGDQLTGALTAAGHPVYKYLPWGPQKEVLPYLARRMEEARELPGDLSDERALMVKEAVRRIRKAVGL